MQLNLVEKYPFAGFGMLDDCRTDLSGPQPSVGRPIQFDTVLPTGLLDDGLVLGVEEILPTDVESRREIPHVH